MRKSRRCVVAAGVLTLLLGCATAPDSGPAVHPVPPTGPETRPTARSQRAPLPAGFSYSGSLIQGGIVIGTAPVGTSLLSFNGAAVPVTPEGRFLIGFDRDAGPAAALVATLTDGRQVRDTLTIAPRAWDISRLETLPKLPVPQPEFERLRPAELAQTASQGWQQHFLWPTTGRISTLFGSQRIYKNGEAGAYHSGIDIAKPQGSVILAPADGVVILATDHPFTLEGNLLMIDHGMGLNSAFLHLSKITVHVGDRVRRGEPIALSGMTGRATGPHLHWSLKWRDAKIDPLLVAGPMPRAE